MISLYIVLFVFVLFCLHIAVGGISGANSKSEEIMLILPLFRSCSNRLQRKMIEELEKSIYSMYLLPLIANKKTCYFHQKSKIKNFGPCSLFQWTRRMCESRHGTLTESCPFHQKRSKPSSLSTLT